MDSNVMDERVKYWVEMSEYDFVTAEAMNESKRYLYVGFMCHQTIEKIFKAFYTQKKNETAPFVHNLSVIAKKGEFYDEFSEDQKDFIDEIEPLNIEARYPTHKDKIFQSMNETKCQNLIVKTRELQEWIKSKL
jgi:HEPN domain-containing protein